MSILDFDSATISCRVSGVISALLNDCWVSFTKLVNSILAVSKVAVSSANESRTLEVLPTESLNDFITFIFSISFLALTKAMVAPIAAPPRLAITPTTGWIIEPNIAPTAAACPPLANILPAINEVSPPVPSCNAARPISSNIFPVEIATADKRAIEVLVMFNILVYRWFAVIMAFWELIWSL